MEALVAVAPLQGPRAAAGSVAQASDQRTKAVRLAANFRPFVDLQRPAGSFDWSECVGK
jgi:hypothetical protein